MSLEPLEKTDVQPGIDLRLDSARSDEWNARSGESRYQDLLAGVLLRDGPWLSPNARAQLVAMFGAAWVEPLKLADRIESGRARETEDEHDVLYETYPDLIDTVIDLFNMVSRRDETIETLRQERDSLVAALGEATHGDQAHD